MSVSEIDRKNTEMVSVFRDGRLPVLVFEIRSVVYTNAHLMGMPWRDHVGDLFFTDIGVIFSNLSEIKAPSFPAGLMFGLVGETISSFFYASRKKKAIAEAADKRIRFENICINVDTALAAFMIPMEIISGFKYSMAFGFQILSTEEPRNYQFENKKATYKEFQPQLDDYLPKMG